MNNVDAVTEYGHSVYAAQNVAMPGTGVKVGVIRRGKADPDEVDLVREKLAPAKIIAAKADPDILVLRLPSLEPGRADEIRSRLQDAEKQGAQWATKGDPRATAHLYENFLGLLTTWAAPVLLVA